MANESESGLPDPKESVNKDEFNNWLINKVSRQSTMVSRAYGEKIIQYLREERENGPDSPIVKSKHTSSFRFQVKKRKFQLLNVVGLGDILCLPIKDKSKDSHAMLGEHRQVIFKEDMYQVIHSAHVNGERHRGYKGTFKKINATYCNIPREVVSKFVTMCKFCRKAHACFAPSNSGNNKGKQKKKKDFIQKKKEIEMTFMTRCQVDILDMQSFPDSEGNFSYILHFIDHHTKYNVLIPLRKTDAFYVAKKLCRYVFGHFGLPRIIHCNLGRKYVDEVITWILQFWSTDAQILNGNPRFKKMNTVIEQRQKTIMMLIETIRGKQTDVSNWSSWLPGIQYSLNTNQFEVESPPSYYAVYTRRPKVYTYAPSSKDIPREEDVIEEEPCDEVAGNINEVITVSMTDLLQNGTGDTILISQMPTDDTTAGLSQHKNLSHTGDVLKSGATIPTELINSSVLAGIPLSLGDQQYTIISTNLGVDGQTIQIPVVNIGSTAIAIQGDPSASMDQGKSMMESVDTSVSLDLHHGTPITLSDSSSTNELALTHPNHLSLRSHQHEPTLTLTGRDDSNLGGLDHQNDNSLTLNSGDNASLVLDTQDDGSLGLNDLGTDHVTGSLGIPNLKIGVLTTDTNGQVDNEECFVTKETSSEFTMTTLDTSTLNTSPTEDSNSNKMIPEFSC